MLTAVLTQVQVAVEPAIRVDVRRDVPSSATEVADEYAATIEPRPRRRGAAHEHMLLMAVDHVGPPKLAEYRAAEGIGALSTDKPRITDDANLQQPHLLLAVFVAEADERRRHNIGHVTGKLEPVPFCAADDAGRSEQCRNEMRHAHAYFTTSSWKYRNHAGNIHAHRRSYSWGQRFARRKTARLTIERSKLMREYRHLNRAPE